MSIIDNALVLGILVFILTLFFRKMGWGKDGVPALWLTMGVAVAIAVCEWLLQGGLNNIVVCELPLQDPSVFLTCLWRIIEVILKEAGVIFALSQAVYQLLRREIADKSILGKRI